MDDTETSSSFVAQVQSSKTAESLWGFGHEPWHDFCFQKCIVSGKLCSVILSITDELSAKICSKRTDANPADGVCPNSLTEGQMDRIAKFCIFLINRILSENHFSWDDVTVSFFNPGRNLHFKLIIDGLALLFICFTSSYIKLLEYKC